MNFFYECLKLWSFFSVWTTDESRELLDIFFQMCLCVLVAQQRLSWVCACPDYPIVNFDLSPARSAGLSIFLCFFRSSWMSPPHICGILLVAGSGKGPPLQSSVHVRMMRFSEVLKLQKFATLFSLRLFLVCFFTWEETTSVDFKGEIILQKNKEAESLKHFIYILFLFKKRNQIWQLFWLNIYAVKCKHCNNLVVSFFCLIEMYRY